MNIRFKLVFLLSTLFLVTIGNILLTRMLESYGEEKLDYVIHTHEILIESKDLISAMKDAETGQRGYLLTHNAEYLEPYIAGTANAKKHLNRLKNITFEKPLQEERLKKIESLMEQKFNELDTAIKLIEKHTPSSHSEALEIVNQNKGKEYMDAIRDEILAFNNDELILLEYRKGELKKNRAYITTLMGFELIFFVFMAVITGIFIRSKFFQPIEILLDGTAKMEKGMRQEVSDILPKDEMGYLLSRFYKMSEVVYEKYNKLDYDATHDSLTGLRNRAKFEEEIEVFISKARKEKKIALLFIDLDKFKEMNDTQGHDTGDAVLKETAERLKNSIRYIDAVYRLGGDEFVVVLNEIRETSNVQSVVEKIVENFSTPFTYQSRLIKILPSIGIAISPDDTVNSKELVKLSDIAMYAAKCDESTSYKFFEASMLKRESDKFEGDTPQEAIKPSKS
ncbi:diguanylate cyclase [Sulfurovum sp.]|jgi:diguanylate cyclase (GGDEF)-like protein|uniref:diguanylate cyclase domain-containing protein n=1 Tax=Sulfurovum sp. TaxID=1969726 RepID=UPI002A37106C|nr:diguanylate cyclase [Sulfurovum sp.]MDY0402348.1 diguanylate cyclase [Sulfurovum sp.]